MLGHIDMTMPTGGDDRVLNISYPEPSTDDSPLVTIDLVGIRAPRVPNSLDGSRRVERFGHRQ